MNMSKIFVMKRKKFHKKIWICGLLMMVTIMTGCSKNTSMQNPINESQTKVSLDGNVLVAYFSRVGNTDFPSDVDASSSASILRQENDIVGNTQYLAEVIQQETNGDIFLIQTEEQYPIDYHETDMQAKDENANRTKVQLANHIDNMDEYDTIFLGFPTWYYDMPMAIYAFLDEYDLSGKTLILFNTSGGSGLSEAMTEIQEREPKATVVTNGLTVNHNQIADLDIASVQEWLQSLQSTDK